VSVISLFKSISFATADIDTNIKNNINIFFILLISSK